MGAVSEWERLWGNKPKESDFQTYLEQKLDAVKEVMETLCEDVDCDLFNEDKAEWCIQCPIYELLKILEDSDAEKEEDS